MAGLLDSFFGTPEQTQALGLLGVGMMNGGFGQGAGNAMQFLAGADDRRLKRGLLQAQLEETQAQAQERQLKAQREQRAMEVQRQIPGLFRQPGMTGGEAVPQTLGGVPMFSQPMGAAPMRPTAGGFDVMKALELGLTPEQISAYAGLQNVGRPKATRQMEVDDGRGGKRIALVDDFGQEVAGFAGYTAPVQVQQGDRVSFVKPAPGVSLPVNMSPSERDASARGWASVRQGEQRLALDRSNAAAGRAPAGYRFKADGSLEAIPGGPSDKQAAATTDERKAATLLQRLEGSQRQLEEALKTNPKAAKPELMASGLRSLGMEAAANTVTNTQRQQVDAAQLDMLDAALTLGTGAAYTREQLEGYRRSFFPQLGDDPPTVADKQARLNNVIQAARIAAGRAANKTVGAGGATGGWSIQKVN